MIELTMFVRGRRRLAATICLTILFLLTVGESVAVAAGAYPVAVDDFFTFSSVDAVAGNVLLNDTDAEGDPKSARAVYVSDYRLRLDSSGNLSFLINPPPWWSGVMSATYKAFDGTNYSDTASVLLIISPVSALPGNSSPIASADATQVAEDQPRLLTVLENDFDFDGHELSPVKVTDPLHGSIVATTGGFIYTPAPNYNGTDTFDYLASDANSFSVPVSVTITVTPVNDAPSAMADTVTVNEDTPKLIGVLSNDTPHFLSVEYTGQRNPASLNANINVDAFGVITDGTTYYHKIESSDPPVFLFDLGWAPSSSSGDSGQSLLTGGWDRRMTVGFNGTGIDVIARTDLVYGIARLTLDSVETTMVDLYSWPTRYQHVVYSRRGLAVKDVDGEPLTAVKVSDPLHGSIVATSGGFMYTPVANYNGPDSFTYQASDGASSSAPVTVTISVAPVNDPPSAQPDCFTVSEDTPRLLGVLLNDVPHVLTVEHTGQKNPASLNDRINMDAFGVITNAATYDSAFESSDSRVTRAGVWTSASVTGASGGSILYGSSGCGATVAFNGTGIDFIALTGPTYGIARLTLDSVETTTVDLYSPTYMYKRVAYSRRGLAVVDIDGPSLSVVKVTDPSHGRIVASSIAPHVLTVEHTGQKNPASSNDRINMDAFGVITDAATYDSAFESSDSRVTRAGVWTSASVTGASGGSILYGSSGCGATVAFNGTGIDFIALTGPTYGIARLTLDSVATTTVDLYSPTYVYKRVVYSRRGLAVTDIDGQTPTVVADPSHGSLVATQAGFFYAPDADYSGADSFTYCASDGITSSAPVSVTIDVAPLNDPPSFTKGPDITVVGDSRAYFSAWATSISPGPANESQQSLRITVAVSEPSLFKTAPVLTTAGMLGFQPAPGAWGSSVCTATLFDDATAGGPAMSHTETFTITVKRRTWFNIKSKSEVLPRYGATYSVSGSVLSTDAVQVLGVGSVRVRLQTAPTAYGPYSDTSVVATTSSVGSFTLSHVPRTKTFYRVVCEGDSMHAGSRSVYRYALPRTAVGVPVAPSVMYAGRATSVYSILKPQHRAGTYPVRIYIYRYTLGAWRSYGYVNARAWSIPGSSKCVAAVKLPYRGVWRLRAYSRPDGGHAATWSVDYDYVTVK